MSNLYEEIDKVLNQINEKRWISLSKSSPDIVFKAKDVLRAYKLIERQGELSWRLTEEGYKAIDLGGFENWKKTQLKNNPKPPIVKFLINFWWLFVIPLAIMIILYLIAKYDLI